MVHMKQEAYVVYSVSVSISVAKRVTINRCSRAKGVKGEITGGTQQAREGR